MADEIAQMAREAMEDAWTYDRDNRKEMVEDLKFIAGFQWPDVAQRERKGRPMITINRSGQFLRQVSNPIRQNMPTIKVEPIDKGSDDNMMEIYNGLLRQIQYNSSASHVYANAVEHAVGCGIGWFRVLTDYVDDEGFDQELMIKRIVNPLSVFADPASTEPARDTMSYCLVSELIPRKAFERKYPGKITENLDAPSDQKMQTTTFWQSGDNIRIAEFWRREETTGTLLMLQDGSMQDASTFTKRGMEYLREKGMIVNDRTVKRHKVTMTLVSGAEQLEETYECPCKWIPVIPVIGAEIPLEKGTYRHGLIRFQREPQQLQNYWLSVLAEAMGQQAKTPWLVDANSVAPFKDHWDNVNKVPLPYLPYNAGKDVPPPTRLPPPPLPQGYAELAAMFAEDMKAVTGVYDASLGNRSNETSGIAINARKMQGDQATFNYVDNLEHSLEHLGRVLIDMIPKVYDTPRTMRFVGEDGTESTAEINQPSRDENFNPVIINDLSKAKFDIRVIIGPNYATRRQEALAGLTELAKADPRLFEIGGDIIVRSMDFPGAEELAERYKTILPPQILGVEDPQAAAVQAPQPDPIQQAMGQQALAQGDAATAESQAKASKAQADAEQSHHRAQGAAIDNLLKLRQLHSPPPQPGAGNGTGRP